MELSYLIAWRYLRLLDWNKIALKNKDVFERKEQKENEVSGLVSLLDTLWNDCVGVIYDAMYLS